MQSLALLLLLGSLSSLVLDARADQDDMNASIDKAKKKFQSYQSDPVDLIRGIEAGEYEQIYVQYHSCVWSEFVNDDDDDGDEEGGKESGCNGNGDGEDDPWYMGNTQCYRANVAYSLYGVRATEDDNEIPKNACRKRYYINTFFTNNGMDYFGNLLGLEYYGDATSQCTLSDDGNGNDDGSQDEGDNNSYQHNAQLYPNAKSYTTYCASGQFVTAMFSGAYCTGKGDLETVNTLTDLNGELDAADCILAYSADDYNGDDDNSGDENENGRRLEEEGEGDEDEEEEEEEEDRDIWDLLSYSNTCSILEYPKGCPDPFGVKKRFDLNPRTKNGFFKQLHSIDWLSMILFVLGTFLLLLTCCIKDRDPEKKKRKMFAFRRRSKSPSRSRQNSNNNKNGNNDSDTVDTNGENVKRKRRGFRGFFSRKK